MKQEQLQRKEIAQMKVSKRFGRYMKEEKKKIREAEVKEDKALKLIMDAWESCKLVSGCNSHNQDMEKATKGLHCTASDIAKFCLFLNHYKDEWNFSSYAGRFLSSLIFNGADHDYMVPTGHLKVMPDGLCMDNCKNVRIEGDVGNAFGLGMESGSIIINGNAGNELGCGMKSGCIIVHGNAGDMVGCAMEGGIIIIEGNGGFQIGNEMIGGTITVKGNVGNSSGCYMKGGRIIIENNAGNYTGACMKGGEIIVKGNAEKCLGNEMEGGEIRVEGDMDGIGEQWSHLKGVRKIFHKGKIIYESD